MPASKIEWTQWTWNAVSGCTKISPGCAKCYAEQYAIRFNRNGGSYLPGKAEIICHEDRLDAPLRRKKPTVFFVNSTSDFFHEDIPDEFRDKMFGIMALADRHIFQILTKRPDRMLEYMTRKDASGVHVETSEQAASLMSAEARAGAQAMRIAYERGEDVSDPWWDTWWHWPLKNVWMGVSVENQYWADDRLPKLMYTPAAVRFVSAEPILKPFTLFPWTGPNIRCQHNNWAPEPDSFCDPCHCYPDRPALDWLILGGESGPDARECYGGIQEAMLDLKTEATSTPIFVKQMGTRYAKQHGLKGKADDIEALPHDLKVRNYPAALDAWKR